MSSKILVEVLGDASSYERALKKSSQESQVFERQQESMRKGVEKTHHLIGSMTAGLVGAGGLVFGLEQVIDVAKRAEESQGHLSVTMKDAGLSYEQNRQQIEQLLSKQSELAGFQKTDLRESYARLVTATQDVGKSNEYLALTTDIARGRHISLEASTQLVIKASMGMTGQLKRQGIEIAPVHDAMNALTDSHLKFTAAQKEEAKALDLAATKQLAIATLQKRYAGQAEEYGKSSAGAADKFKVSLTNLEITLGTALLPTLTDGLKHVTKWVNKLNDSGDAAKYAKEGVDIVKGAIHDITPIVEGGFHGFQHFADAVGGTKNALEILGGVIVGVKVMGALKALRAELILVRDAEIGAKLAALGPAAVIAASLIPVASFLENPNKQTFDTSHGTVYQSADGKWRLRSTGSRAKPQVISAAKAAELTGGASTVSAGSAATSALQTGSRPAKDQGAAIAAVAATQLGISYQWGGPAILGQHTDCSGLAQAVLAKNGINIGRTTYEQWGQGKPVAVGDLQPGDLVFFHLGKKGPEHVGIYIGNDQFIEDPHTGASVRVSKLSTYPGFVGARRYTSTAASTATAGTKGDAGTGGKGGVNDIVKQGKAKKVAALTGSKLLTTATQIALADSKGTKGTADDLTALDKARSELEAMPHSVAVAKELATINNQIHTIETANVKAHLAEQAASYKKYAKEAAADLKALDTGWKTHVGVLKQAAADATAIADRSFGEAEGSLFKNFDRLTQMGLNNLVVAQTPEEKAYADFIAKRQADDLAKSRTDALANAQTDEERATLALGFSLDDQETALKQAADQSRAAQDKATADAQQAYQDQRDIDRQKLQDWLDDQKKALDAGSLKWDTFYADLKTKAAAGGWDIGTAFWDAWNQAATDRGAADRATTIANNPGTGDLLQTIEKGLQDGTISKGLGDLLRSGHKLEIPFLADGGIVTRPTIAVIGESGHEAVIPLSRLGTPRDGGGGTPTLQLTVVSDRDLAARIAPYIDDTGSALVRLKVN